MFDFKTNTAFKQALLLHNEWHFAINLFFQPNVGRLLAIKTAKRYWNSIDYEVFGENQAKRRGQRLLRACFLEWGRTNWHYHCIVQLPDGWRNRQQFALGLRCYWESLPNAGEYGRFEQVRLDEQWMQYIIKGEARGQDTFCVETSTIA
jgi:hypothetical protein